MPCRCDAKPCRCDHALLAPYMVSKFNITTPYLRLTWFQTDLAAHKCSGKTCTFSIITSALPLSYLLRISRLIHTTCASRVLFLIPAHLASYGYCLRTSRLITYCCAPRVLYILLAHLASYFLSLRTSRLMDTVCAPRVL